MKKNILLLAMIALGFGACSISQAQNINMSLEITPGRIAIDSSGSIDIGAISISPTEINQTFSADAFRMIDLRGGPGYYTTVQFGDLIKGSDRITNDNIQLKTISTPSIIGGSNAAGQIRFGSGIENQFGYTNPPTNYFVRNPNQGTGLVGIYGDTPDIKITVPASTPSGTYRGTIYYTLYDIE